MAFPLQAQACLKVSSKESALGQAGHLMVTGRRAEQKSPGKDAACSRPAEQ